MDANKAEVLASIGYRIHRTCDLCEHADIAPDAAWGTCQINTYRHGKHTGPERQLSIHRSGGCSKFHPDPGVEVALHGFADFLT